MSPGSLQDLLARTCTRSCNDLWQHFTRIFRRSSHKDLYKIRQGPRRRFHQDLYKIFSQATLEDLDQELHARTFNRTSQDRHKKSRSSYKNFPRAPQKSFRQEHPQDQGSFIARRTMVHGICKIFMQGPISKMSPRSPTDFLTRTSARSWSQELHTKTSKRISQDHHRGTCYREDPTRPLQKNLFKASHKSFHTSTSNTGHRQWLRRGMRQDLHKFFSSGPVQIMQGHRRGFHQPGSS